MTWQPMILFALGVLFGALVTWCHVCVQQRRMGLNARGSHAQAATTIKRTLVTERSTVELKPGVLPYDCRPTLVYEPMLPGVAVTPRDVEVPVWVDLDDQDASNSMPFTRSTSAAQG